MSIISSSFQETSHQLEDGDPNSSFRIEATLSERVQDVAYKLILGLGIYGLYLLAVGETGGTASLALLATVLMLRQIAATSIGYMVYPAALPSFIKKKLPLFQKKLDQSSMVKSLSPDELIVRKITLYHPFAHYDAALVAHPDTIHNGHWVINALGNAMAVGNFLKQIAKRNYRYGCNTLFVNGPSVEKSGGWPTLYQMGAGFEAGIQFLEKEIKATHVIMHGFSLGGGMMGEAILQHDFRDGLKRGVKYLSITDRSFSQLSEAASGMVALITRGSLGVWLSLFVKPLFFLLGMELDNVKAAKKLSDLQIQQIIIQHEPEEEDDSDDVIPDRASLAHALMRTEAAKANKVFLTSFKVRHERPLPSKINQELKERVQEFLES